MNREECLAFAVGKIGEVLGAKYAEIDAFPTRVRLPDEPLMLVDRIVEIDAEPLAMKPGRLVTEHDIHPGAWYLDGGRIPTCIAVESGQADLFLSGYAGVDFVTRGLAVYRLLDAVVTFHGPLARAGKTIRYDIRIDEFFTHAGTQFFRFRFDATVDGELFLTMTEGCAGFFTSEALAAGRGVVRSAVEAQPRPGKRPADWMPLAPMTAVEAYSEAQIDALRAGDWARAFGPAFESLAIRKPAGLPDGRMRLVHRVSHLDPKGGRYGLGIVRGEADIHPDDWFLTCHFVDDRVMPGTLMYECCLHTLRVFLLRMGWVAEADAVVYEPKPGVPGRLKCRGQVIESTKIVTYEVEIKELGYDPAPFAIADALMYADGKPIVEMTNMSLRLSGLTRDCVEAVWDESNRSQASGGREPPVLSIVEERTGQGAHAPRSPRTDKPLFDRDRILAFAIGKPSDAFGDRYRDFDGPRKIARLPGPPYQFLDRVVSIQNGEAWKLAAGCEIVAEYDVPPGEWYFDANRGAGMPFAVLLEIALQPCGWLAAYLGSALTSETDLSFRNLGGRGVLHEAVGPEIGTLSTTVKMTRVSASGGMIIQHYDFAVRAGGRKIYDGDTYFGFFSKDALANQVGIREATLYTVPDANAGADVAPVPSGPPFPDDRLRMMQTAIRLPTGGPKGLGFVEGRKRVDPSEWFFKAHFFEDPVWPGSLGLEALLQMTAVWAADRWGTPRRFQSVVPGIEHRWVYRGQVIPQDAEVRVQAEVRQVDDERRAVVADGLLWVDGRTIYQMSGFSVGWNDA